MGMVFQLRALPASDGRRERRLRTPRAGRGVRVAEALALVGLAEHGDRYPHQLSHGGQQQRVALSASRPSRPSCPGRALGNIDPVLRTSMRDELAGILRATGVTVLLVTHEQEEAFIIADRVAVMRDGAIVQAGVPEEIYYAPATRWAAEFVGPPTCCPGGSRTGWWSPRRPLPGAQRRRPRRRRGARPARALALNPDPAGEERSSPASSAAATSSTVCGWPTDDRLLAAALQRVDPARRPRGPAAARRPAARPLPP